MRIKASANNFLYHCTMKSEAVIFERIAIAVAFSPRCEAILAEARFLQQTFKSRMFFVHVGQQKPSAGTISFTPTT